MADNAVTLRLDLRDFNRNLDRLMAKAPYAICRALDRAAVSARTVMARQVASDLGIPVGSAGGRRRTAHTAMEAMSVEKARPETLTSRVVARGARIPLIEFKARGREPSRGRGRGVTARLPGGAGRYPHGFIATMASGHRGVFTRIGRPRTPIVELHGPSIVHVFDKHREAGRLAGEVSLVKNLQHEFRWALSEAAAGGS